MRAVTERSRDDNSRLFYALGLATALALKIHYSVAAAEDLYWMLLPTATLVEALSGLPFVYERSEGFINRVEGVLIAPSCAGVNYLIIAFCSFYFSIVSRFRGSGAKVAWLGLSLGLGYAVTLGANVVRILVSILLLDAHLYGGWVTPERVHRIQGTVIYFLFLLSTYLLMDRAMEAWRPRRGWKPERFNPSRRAWGSIAFALLVPFFWYTLVTLGVPLINGLDRVQDARFVEHGLLVLSVSLGVLLTFFSVIGLCRVWRSKTLKLKRG